MNRTKKLYQQNMYLRESTGTIIEIHEDVVTLDQTPFYPEGGGQPCDLGAIGKYRVTDVVERDDVVYHKLDLAGEIMPYKPGDEVLCGIDWDRRFDHMQNHCGEHILSGIFFRRYAGINRGFRLGHDLITIDIDFRGTVSEGMKAEQLDMPAIELEANEIIWRDTPVSIRYYDKKEDAENLPLRKALAIESDISIVCVGEEKNPSDCVACCGTHPSTAGQVGLIKLLRAENYKGMIRIYFKCGKRALEDYGFKHTLVNTIKTKYSIKEDMILEQLAIRDEKAAALRRELKTIRNSQSESSGIRSVLNNSDRA